MSYGIYTKGDFNQVLLSADSSSLSFMGKATFVSKQGSYNQPLYMQPSGYPPIYNWPAAGLYNYTFNSGGKECIFFVTNEYPRKNAVVAASLSGNIYTLTVAAQSDGDSNYVPEVYCFHKSNSLGNSGYGMTLYKDSGEIAFTTNDKVLIINKIYTPNTQYSNLTEANFGSLSYVGNGNSPYNKTISYHNPIADSSSPVKPIIYTPSYQTAVRYIQYQSAFFELLSVYNPSTNQVEYEWCCPFFQSFANYGTYQTSARTGFTMIADGSKYD